MEPVLINSYNDYIKKQFGKKIRKLSIDADFTCPNRDGTKGVGGCTYCNNFSFGPALKYEERPILKQLDAGIKKLERRYHPDGYIAYFQNFTNTYAPLLKLKEMYDEALSHPQVLGLSIGTRTDCLDDEKLDYFEELSTKTELVLEVGLESISEETLKRINRGHTVEEFFLMHDKIKKRGIKNCIHLILGFPWEDQSVVIPSAKRISEAKPTFLKVHQLHIVKGSIMGNEYRKAPFHTLSEDEYMEWAITFLDHLDPEICIQRIFGDAPKEFLLSPPFSSLLSQLQEKLLRLMKERGVYQGRSFHVSR